MAWALDFKKEYKIHNGRAYDNMEIWIGRIFEIQITYIQAH